MIRRSLQRIVHILHYWLISKRITISRKSKWIIGISIDWLGQISLLAFLPVVSNNKNSGIGIGYLYSIDIQTWISYSRYHLPKTINRDIDTFDTGLKNTRLNDLKKRKKKN